ncbi:CobW family GTP-binding protein [Sphaerisporangium perillae]|uniref:CobW family GTP-binding protein n=1 Tax=Sphaerisporangium perillae TaxID=2935860 RepID=UPI00200E0A80|nr:GTP-binding protein [Sphaerisporangium perillae]
MTLLRPPAHPAQSRRGVTLLSGFLGSGKTTLLRRELARTGADAPAVILNDFGHTMVDDVLLTTDGERPVVLSGGCACCTRRDDLALALAGLLDSEQRGGAPRRDHVIIETSGLADPGPIAFTVAHDPVLKHHYALARVCVTVDALTGLGSIEHHEVALRQLLAADELLVTKADLAEPDDVDELVRRLHQMNPSAGVSVTANGELLRAEEAVSARRGPAAPPVVDATHTSGVSTLELVVDEPLDWQAFSVWLSLLLHARGTDVLRVKGVLDVRGVGPVAVNGVQHVIHRPEHLGVPVPPGTRLVFIVRDIDTELLERSFHTFLAID